jgi:two-component system CheB/CheR fusion protein
MQKTEPLRILVVEDHTDSRVALLRLLEGQGHIVLIAHDVASARSAARSADLDLVICDVGLPDGDGCELMKSLLETSGVACICVSGYGDADHIRRATAAGICIHLCKPIAFAQLIAAIEKCRPNPAAA